MSSTKAGPYITVSDCNNQPDKPYNVPSISDITGYGVFIGLVAPAVLTLLVLMAYYIIAYDPTMDPHRRVILERSGEVHSEKEDDDHVNPKHRYRPNPFDMLVLRVARKALSVFPVFRPFPHSWAPSRAALYQAFNKCILSLADIQSVTGLCMMTAGFYLLKFGMTAVHWKYMVYVTWFCCATHLSALVFLRSYLIHNLAQRVWRLVLMVLLVVVLIVALVPTAHFWWILPSSMDPVAQPSAYAICYFYADGSDAYPAKAGRHAAIFSAVVLVSNLVVRILMLHDPGRWIGFRSFSALLIHCLKRSATWCQSRLGTTHRAVDWPTRLASNLIVAAHFVVCMWVDLVSSMASNIFWLFLTMWWGFANIESLWLVLENSTHEQDHSWTIGQILPVGLLALPALVLLEPWTDMFSTGSGTKKAYPIDADQTSAARQRTSVDKEPDNLSPACHEILRLPTTSFPTEGFNSHQWLLVPDRYEEYYRNTAWMFWAPSLCLNYILSFAVWSLLHLHFSTAGSFLYGMPWLVIQQGSLVHGYIVLISLAETLVKPKWANHVIAVFFSMGLFAASWWNVFFSGVNPSIEPTQFISAGCMLGALILAVGASWVRKRLRA